MRVYTSRINVSIPTDFLEAVDEAAKRNGMNRSTFIRIALKEKMGLKDLVNLEAYLPLNRQKLPRPVNPSEYDYDEEFREYLESLGESLVE